MVEPISRFMISLLAGDGVADFCRSGAGELAHGGRLVHFGDGEGTYGVHDGATDLAAGGVLDLTDFAIDGEVIAGLDPVLRRGVDNVGAIGPGGGNEAGELDDLN